MAGRFAPNLWKAVIEEEPQLRAGWKAERSPIRREHRRAA